MTGRYRDFIFICNALKKFKGFDNSTYLITSVLY